MNADDQPRGPGEWSAGRQDLPRPASKPIARLDQSDDDVLVTALTRIVREADAIFTRVGGSSRHWVRDCFLPLLNQNGIFFTQEPLRPRSADASDPHVGSTGNLSTRVKDSSSF